MAARATKNTLANVGSSDGSDLEHIFGYNLKRAYMVVHAGFREAVEADGLSARVFSALSLVVHFPNITQSALARRLGIERSGLVAIVDELETLGYVTRAAVPKDRRVQALVPSPAGRAAYRDALRKSKAREAEILAHLSAEEKATLLRLLKKIRELEDQE